VVETRSRGPVAVPTPPGIYSPAQCSGDARGRRRQRAPRGGVRARRPDANSRSIPDALWRAVTTVTTVGYGGRFPTTPAGRGVGIALMLVGIALFGLLAGSLTL
jgi:hypothetical protein